MIKAGIIGATGYAGAELVRLLMMHPEVEISAISSVSFEGKPISEIYPAYYSLNDMICENADDVVAKSDVIFAALPHGLSQELAKTCHEKDKIFIDLGADFRLENEDDYKEWYGGEYTDKELHKNSVYALPEFFRKNIVGKKTIANPGCYTTGVPLAIGPAVAKGLVETKGIIADCKSGATGAGRGLSQNTHFTELNESFHPYKVACHRHTPERKAERSDGSKCEPPPVLRRIQDLSADLWDSRLRHGPQYGYRRCGYTDTYRSVLSLHRRKQWHVV